MCHKKFCLVCIKRVYPDSEPKPNELAAWLCPACTNQCTCASCVSLRANPPLTLATTRSEPSKARSISSSKSEEKQNSGTQRREDVARSSAGSDEPAGAHSLAPSGRRSSVSSPMPPLCPPSLASLPTSACSSAASSANTTPQQSPGVGSWNSRKRVRPPVQINAEGATTDVKSHPNSGVAQPGNGAGVGDLSLVLNSGSPLPSPLVPQPLSAPVHPISSSRTTPNTPSQPDSTLISSGNAMGFPVPSPHTAAWSHPSPATSVSSFVSDKFTPGSQLAHLHLPSSPQILPASVMGFKTRSAKSSHRSSLTLVRPRGASSLTPNAMGRTLSVPNSPLPAYRDHGLISHGSEASSVLSTPMGSLSRRTSIDAGDGEECSEAEAGARIQQVHDQIVDLRMLHVQTPGMEQPMPDSTHAVKSAAAGANMPALSPPFPPANIGPLHTIASADSSRSSSSIGFHLNYHSVSSSLHTSSGGGMHAPYHFLHPPVEVCDEESVVDMRALRDTDELLRRRSLDESDDTSQTARSACDSKLEVAEGISGNGGGLLVSPSQAPHPSPTSSLADQQLASSPATKKSRTSDLTAAHAHHSAHSHQLPHSLEPSTPLSQLLSSPPRSSQPDGLPHSHGSPTDAAPSHVTSNNITFLHLLTLSQSDPSSVLRIADQLSHQLAEVRSLSHRSNLTPSSRASFEEHELKLRQQIEIMHTVYRISSAGGDLAALAARAATAAPSPSPPAPAMWETHSDRGEQSSV